MSAILIAEDEERIASFVAKGLRASGFSVDVTGRGDEALERALSGDFDLLVLDVGLPGLDGFEVLARLRGSGSTLPVVMLTARTSSADTVAGLEGGADDYVPKPFRFDELLARIRVRMVGRPSEVSADLRHAGMSLDVRTRRGDKPGATADRAAGLAKQPTDEPSFVARGLARADAEPLAALADFDAALKLNPRSFPALQNRAFVLAEKLNRPDEAVSALGKALDLYPDSLPARAGPLRAVRPARGRR